MVEWSNVLPLTACCLSGQVQILAGADEKVASDLGLGNGFRQVLQCSPPLTTG